MNTKLLTLVLALLASVPVRSAVIDWTNTSGGNWSAAANWNPNQVPSTNDTAVITNDGLVTWQSYGNLAIGGTLHNRAGALFDAEVSNRNITRSGDTALFINDGEFRKSVSSGTIRCEATLLNRGTVDNQTGTLTFAGGSALDSGSAFIGAGVTRLEEATNVLNGGLYATNLVLVNGTLTGTGLISGKVIWESGTLASGAVLTVATDGHLLLSSSANYTRFLQGNLTNAGTVTFASRLGEFSGCDYCILLGKGRRLLPVYGETSLTLATVAASEPEGVLLQVTVAGDALVSWPAEFTGYQLYWSTNAGCRFISASKVPQLVDPTRNTRLYSMSDLEEGARYLLRNWQGRPPAFIVTEWKYLSLTSFFRALQTALRHYYSQQTWPESVTVPDFVPPPLGYETNLLSLNDCNTYLRHFAAAPRECAAHRGRCMGPLRPCSGKRP
ncbi:MAG: hypothetical protein JXQ71_01110 [Verrucomicrobia bacterium]|nr:hypothetical protein [Verrucomicrobiota bacterium]